MSGFPKTVETTFADLRPGDLVIDKQGQAWPIADLASTEAGVTFFLCDPVSKIKMHKIDKHNDDPVKVSRKETHAEEAARLEAESPTTDRVEPAAAVETVKEVLGGEVEAEVTAAEEDAANAATEDNPAEIIAFDEMTDLEKRSHLYLLHGVFALDLQARAVLIETHAQAHADEIAGKLNSKFKPHTHKDAS